MKSFLMLLATCVTAFAQVATVPAAYTSTFGGNPPGTYTGIDCCGEDPAGKTACSFSAPDTNTFILMLSGQSLYGNNVNGTLATDSRVCNYNPYDGHLYADGVRLLGPLADTPAGVCVNGDGSQCRDNVARYIAADILSGRHPNSFTKIILISVPIGGSQAGFWAPPNVYAPHMADIVANLVSHGMTPHAVAWGNGESDNQAGTTQTDYYNAMLATIANARSAGLPATVPWLIALETMISVGGVGTGSPAVRAAQLALVDPANHVFNGPDFDVNIPYNTNCRLLPAPHLTGGSVICGGGVTGGGAGWAALLWGNKLHNAGLY
jgi:hypothetical protein